MAAYMYDYCFILITKQLLLCGQHNLENIDTDKLGGWGFKCSINISGAKSTKCRLNYSLIYYKHNAKKVQKSYVNVSCC